MERARDLHDWESVAKTEVWGERKHVWWCKKCGCLQHQKGHEVSHLLVTYRKPGQSVWDTVQPECV